MGRTMMDLTGHKYGRLEVISFSHAARGQHFWNCRCECGKACVRSTQAMRHHGAGSCGCLREEAYRRVTDKAVVRERKALWMMRKGALTLAQLGKMLGVSRQRAHQLVSRGLARERLSIRPDAGSGPEAVRT